MKVNVKSAEELFNETFQRWTASWVIIWSFREVAEVGLPLAKSVVSAQKVALLSELLTKPEHEKLFLVDRQKLIEQKFGEKMAEFFASQSLRHARASVDAASLVFAHSVLDANAFDYLRVTALAAPKDWLPDVQNKQVSLEDVLRLKSDELFHQALKKRLEQLERESLITKIDVLFARCQPPPKWSPMTDYQFDPQRLQKVDKLRQDILHGEALGRVIPNVEQELDYLNRTTMFLLGLVNFRYGLRLDPMHGGTTEAVAI
jgi:hypothetical protein